MILSSFKYIVNSYCFHYNVYYLQFTPLSINVKDGYNGDPSGGHFETSVINLINVMYSETALTIDL